MCFKNLIKTLLAISLAYCAFHISILKDDQKLSHNLINFYKKHITIAGAPTCSFYPTCSQYSKQAFKEYGPIKGWVMTTDRIMRCNKEDWKYLKVDINGDIKHYDPLK